MKIKETQKEVSEMSLCSFLIDVSHSVLMKHILMSLADDAWTAPGAVVF